MELKCYACIRTPHTVNEIFIVIYTPSVCRTRNREEKNQLFLGLWSFEVCVIVCHRQCSLFQIENNFITISF